MTTHLPEGLRVPSKNENFKNAFFSWSDFCYWTNDKMFLDKNNALKRNTSLFCFFIFSVRTLFLFLVER